MIDGRTVLGLVTARRGSKGVPGKNMRPIGGKPMIAWTIEAARQSRCLDRLILSSDDPEIIDFATRLGCEAPFVRPAALAKDDSSHVDVALHALDEIDEAYDILVVLQPTSPLRLIEDIDGCLKRLAECGAPSCVTLCEAAVPPDYMVRLTDDGRLEPLVPFERQPTRRQELSPIYHPNGAVFAIDVNTLRKRKRFYDADSAGYLMPPERSLDVDTPFQFQLGDLLLRARAKVPAS